MIKWTTSSFMCTPLLKDVVKCKTFSHWKEHIYGLPIKATVLESRFVTRFNIQLCKLPMKKHKKWKLTTPQPLYFLLYNRVFPPSFVPVVLHGSVPRYTGGHFRHASSSLIIISIRPPPPIHLLSHIGPHIIQHNPIQFFIQCWINKKKSGWISVLLPSWNLWL